MTDINAWCRQAVEALGAQFQSKLFFAGLQGSYRRGEATDESDIDLVVVLEKLDCAALLDYRKVLDTLAFREKSCGFLCGKNELLAWPKYDMFFLLHDTRPLYGSLAFLQPLIQKEDVRQAVQIGASGLYHSLCHSFLHSASQNPFTPLFKPLFFTMLAKQYAEHGVYYENQAALAAALKDRGGSDFVLFSLAEKVCRQTSPVPSEANRLCVLLLSWCQQLLERQSGSPA